MRSSFVTSQKLFQEEILLTTTSYIAVYSYSLIVLINVSLCCGTVVVGTKLLFSMVLFLAFVTASSHPPPTVSSIISAVSYSLLITEAWFNPRPVHVGFVVDRVALRQDFPQVLWFPTIIIVPPVLHIH